MINDAELLDLALNNIAQYEILYDFPLLRGDCTSTQGNAGTILLKHIVLDLNIDDEEQILVKMKSLITDKMIIVLSKLDKVEVIMGDDNVEQIIFKDDKIKRIFNEAINQC